MEYLEISSGKESDFENIVKKKNIDLNLNEKINKIDKIDNENNIDNFFKDKAVKKNIHLKNKKVQFYSPSSSSESTKESETDKDLNFEAQKFGNFFLNTII